MQSETPLTQRQLLIIGHLCTIRGKSPKEISFSLTDGRCQKRGDKSIGGVGSDLGKLANDGYVKRIRLSARGRNGERHIFVLTDKGAQVKGAAQQATAH